MRKILGEKYLMRKYHRRAEIQTPGCKARTLSIVLRALIQAKIACLNLTKLVNHFCK